jgi:hypothetical protein
MNVSEYQPRFSFRGMIRGDGGRGKSREDLTALPAWQAWRSKNSRRSCSPKEASKRHATLLAIWKAVYPFTKSADAST